MTSARVGGRQRGRHRRPGWVGGLRALGLLVGALLAVPLTGVGPAAAAPDGDYATRLSFAVSSISPTLVTASGPGSLTVTGTMTNTGPDELVDLSYRFQRGDALDSSAEVHDRLASPSEPVSRVPSTFSPLAGNLPAGGSAPFTFTASLTDPNELDITEPGVYPVMVNVNGKVILSGGPLDARIGELYLLLTVMSLPGPAGPGQPVATPDGSATPVNFVWPLVDVPHLGVGGVFLNDDLLTAISPGGRLATLLDGLDSAAARELPDGSLTVVVDPQLLDELDRMTGPYRVVAPGSTQPAVTALPTGATATSAAETAAAPTGGGAPESVPTTTSIATGASPGQPPSTTVDIPGTVAGAGQPAATVFLDRLRRLTTEHPVVVLPYGDPDVVALTRAGLTAEVNRAQEQGRAVAGRLLGDTASVISDTAFPIDGAVDDDTLATLVTGGDRTALLSQASVSVPAGPDGRPATSALIDGRTGTGMPAVIAQTDVLGGLDKLIDDRQQTGWAMKVNSLTAILAQQRADGTATPAVFSPVRRWSPDRAGLDGFVQLLGEFGRAGVITGESLAALATTAAQPGTTAYPAQGQDRELPPEFLQRIADDRTSVAGLRSTLSSVPQPTDPAAVLDPLDEALDAAASTAFRADPAVGEANLTTVESTVAGIRAGVQIASAGNSYTLASSSSPLVLTVQNGLPYDVPVTVAITGGEMVGLTVTDQPVQVIPAGRSQQVKIPTEVTRSGQFQVTATLVGPDGYAWGSPVQLSVESSAYGALTLILMAVAGAVLVVMVALRIRQRLRARRARIAAAGATASPTRGATDESGAAADPSAAASSLRRAPQPDATTGRRQAARGPAARDAVPPSPPAHAVGTDDQRLVPGVPRLSTKPPENRQEFRP